MLHIAMTIRNRIASGEPAATALSSSESARETKFCLTFFFARRVIDKEKEYGEHISSQPRERGKSDKERSK